MGDVSYKLLIKLALEKEHPDAMFRIAVRYKHGVGLEQDMKKARYLLWKAAKSKHMYSMWLLAIAFSNGRWGLPVNKSKANYWYLQLFRKWLEQAAQGDENAKFYVGMYRLEQIENPALRKSLGLPPLQQQASLSG